MDRDSIIRMARDCGFDDYEQDAMLEGFAALIAAAEREECAKLMEDDPNIIYWQECVDAIRAKGQA